MTRRSPGPSARVERPGLPFAYRILAAAHARPGQLEQARAAVATLLAQCPHAALAEIMAAPPLPPGDPRRRFEHGLRQAGIPAAAADSPVASAVLPAAAALA